MKTMLINITPDLAAKYLQRNTCNRPLRRTVVDGIKAALVRGEYITSHQGIAFTEDGALADGQNRLTAISELCCGVFPMLVTTGLPKAAFKVMDIGLKRTAADCLREDARLTEAANCIAIMCDVKGKNAQSPTKLIPFINKIRGVHSDLIAHCGTIKKTWSAVAIRVAAVVAILRGGDPAYVQSVYRSLVLTDFDLMPPVAKALFKSQLSGLLNVNDKADTIARCLVVFDKKRSGNVKIQIHDKQETYRVMRETFFDLIA